MPSQVITSVENNFTKGLVTEFTGMNFPENAAIDCDNTVFTLIGNTPRREGFDYEENFVLTSMDRTNKAVNTYKWNNVAGDGATQFLVAQVGSTLHFYNVSASTTASPISANKLASTIDLTLFTATGSSFDVTSECQFTDGNGYLFVFHPDMEPVYCTYSSGAVTGTSISIKIRDFAGIFEDVADDNRPSVLTDSHKYNLQNQGWVSGNPWSAVSTTSNTIGIGAKVFTIASGLTITAGQTVLANGSPDDGGGRNSMTGTVTSYSGSTLTLSITATSGSGTFSLWNITPIVVSQITTWNTAVGNYPSNADQWWRFRNTSDVFDPATTQANTSIGLGAAPKGHYILSAFQQLRSTVSGISGLTDITTLERPTNGTWFQGRIWYTGVAASQAASGTAAYTTWTENIYFSSVVEDPSDFGKCYQTNDPTSGELFDLLPTDGGVIVIQGSGPIYNLFPLNNGMIIFAANGVWFLTGSQGLGFTANDYTVHKISNIQSITCNGYVDVMGLPYFWNEEGIYTVVPTQHGGLDQSLTVQPITVGTILSFYNSIPITCKKHVRAAYHPIDYIIQWTYRSTEPTTTTETFTYNRVLNFNVYNKAFFPFTIDTTSAAVCGINYVSGPGGITNIEPVFKYFVFSGTNSTFGDEHDITFVDWASSGTGVNYDSYFTTGYKLHGQGQRRFQIPYIYVFSKNDTYDSLSYRIQGLWDYATSGNTGRWSTAQYTTIFSPNYSNVTRRHKIRGQGLVLQIKVSSVDGQPYDIIGWSAYEAQNMSV